MELREAILSKLSVSPSHDWSSRTKILCQQMDQARREYDEAIRAKNHNQVRSAYTRMMEIATQLDGEIGCQSNECGEPTS